MNCEFCQHPENDHRPPVSYGAGKSNFSGGGTHQVIITARTCCWNNPLCCCTAFVAPKPNIHGIVIDDSDLPDFEPNFDEQVAQ